jgi:hypothetical protein
MAISFAVDYITVLFTKEEHIALRHGYFPHIFPIVTVALLW